VGANDLRMKPLPPLTYQQIINNYQDNLVKIVEEAKQIKATVILTTIFPLAEGSIPWQWRLTWPTLSEMENAINTINQFIRTSDKFQSIMILDAAQILQNQGKIKPEYARDLLHLNQKGYDRLNQELVKFLLKNNSIAK
jgi:lysophospholipase L1-like esterase